MRIHSEMELKKMSKQELRYLLDESKMIDEYSNKIFEIDEDFDLKKMDKYRMSFLQMLISKKNEISFEEFNKLDIDKIIMYSYIIWSRTM